MLYLISGIAINLISSYFVINYLISGLTMAEFKGGRGKKAPYETVMYRIPVPVRPVVEMLAQQYRQLLEGIADPTGENLVKRVEDAIADPIQLGDEPRSRHGQEGASATDELRSQLAAMEDENARLRSQLDSMAVKADEWYDKAKEAQELAEDRLQEIERLRNESQNRLAADPEAIALLQNAITPKSKGGSYAANNATGLKKLVEQALALLTHD
jgi:hypothetical protein